MYVEVKNVSKTIKKKPVLRDVSVNFERGRIYGIVGPNGSGKTMLLRAICGFIKLDSGEVTIDGKPVVFNDALPENIGVIIETPGFVDSKTAMDNLRYLGGLDGKYDEEETVRLLHLFGLYEHREEKVKSYSLGMRQKLAVVQALMEHQNLILLDEPTNGLDKKSVETFLTEMRHQREQGKTILVASHHDDEISCISDCIVRIADGRVDDVEVCVRSNGDMLGNGSE